MSDELRAPGIVIGDRDERYKYHDAVVTAHLAYTIRILRLQRGLTQDQAAKVCGVEQSQWSRFEDMDGPSPSIASLQKIARGFDVALRVTFEGWSLFFDETGKLVWSYSEEARAKP